MSQNDNKFQSKGKKFGGGGKGRGGPGGGGFKKSFEGDRGGYKGKAGKTFGSGGDRPRKYEGGSGKPRYDKRDSGKGGGFGGDKPYKKREWSSDRPQRSFDKGDRGERRSFDKGGDRPYKKPFREREGGGERSFDKGGDRPYKKPFREGGGERSFDKGGDRPFKKFDKADGGDRPQRRFDKGGDGRPEKPERKERVFEPRPYQKPFRRDARPDGFGERAGRQSFGAKKGRGSFDRRPTRARDFNIDDDIADVELARGPATPETAEKLKSGRPGFGSPSSAFLYGVHAVKAALENPKRIHQRLLVTTNGFEAVRESYEAAQADGLTLPQPTYVESMDIERLLPRDAVHQGVLLDAQPLEDIFLQDLLLTAGNDARILVLDQVTDPHNVGAILRSASAFGAIGVVVQKLHAPDITGTLAKSASGAVEHVPVIREVNLTRAIEQLKDAGYFCIGLAEEGKATLSELQSTGKVALVLGAEGEGLRRLVSETCDTLAKLPTGGPISSLNVSNAAAVALYELVRAA